MPVTNQPSTEALTSFLVVGYGSTLRGDDGVGPAAAERIERLHLEGVQVISCHQLTPELAEPISKARTVVFIDAALNLADVNVRVGLLKPEASPQIMMHTTSPGGLLHLTQSLFKARPLAWLVEIAATEMGVGEVLSPRAQEGVEEAVDKVMQLISAS